MSNERSRETPPSRRAVLRTAAGLAASALLPRGLTAMTTAAPPATGRARRDGPRIVVIGAGAFGGWTALSLLRRGAQVTLVDAWGAGHSRASSGDDTRVIRAIYGGNATYTDMVLRAWAGWHAAEERWGRRVFRQTGALWMFEGDDTAAATSAPLLAARDVEVERMDAGEVARRWPQIRADGIRTAWYEPGAGYLLARLACERVREEFIAMGGTWRLATATPGPIRGGRMAGVVLAEDGNATRLEADAYVFACGPWLGTLFPEAIGTGVLPTRQDVVYFGLPAGDTRYDDGRFPVWINTGARLMYGIPGNERRGFKVADDTAGSPVNPTTLDRRISPAALQLARATVARRFPGLVGAPVAETRVCQYEMSPTGDFLMDRHPEAENAWLLGGGSGHGYKMGPAIGEDLTAQLLDARSVPEAFTYRAFAAARARLTSTSTRRHS
ncbi:MAG: FAD-dependent oxidoreductase [Gemmatimonadota bacterium]